MSRMRFVTCISLTGSLWGLAAFAQSLDGARAAFEAGRFAEAYLQLSHAMGRHALAPADKAVQVGYARGLLALNKRSNRDQARELFTRAAETPPRDAYEAIPREQARAGPAALDGP